MISVAACLNISSTGSTSACWSEAPATCRIEEVVMCRSTHLTFVLPSRCRLAFRIYILFTRAACKSSKTSLVVEELN